MDIYEIKKNPSVCPICYGLDIIIYSSRSLKYKKGWIFNLPRNHISPKLLNKIDSKVLLGTSQLVFVLPCCRSLIYHVETPLSIPTTKTEICLGMRKQHAFLFYCLRKKKVGFIVAEFRIESIIFFCCFPVYKILSRAQHYTHEISSSNNFLKIS